MKLPCPTCNGTGKVEQGRSDHDPDAICECGHFRTQHSPVIGADYERARREGIKLTVGCMTTECKGKCKKFRLKKDGNKNLS